MSERLRLRISACVAFAPRFKIPKMPPSLLDHITITAFSLEAGAAFVVDALGVAPQVGGEHPRMGTHNLLLRLGESMFLEVIAPNPAVAASSEPLGQIEPMNRGALNWLITIPADGSVALDGAAPALIEWHTDGHPAAKLPDKGLSLAKLDIVHPDPDRVSRLLASLQLDAPVSVVPAPQGAPARLVAHIHTPQGLRVLSAPSLCA